MSPKNLARLMVFIFLTLVASVSLTGCKAGGVLSKIQGVISKVQSFASGLTGLASKIKKPLAKLASGSADRTKILQSVTNVVEGLKDLSKKVDPNKD